MSARSLNSAVSALRNAPVTRLDTARIVLNAMPPDVLASEAGALVAKIAQCWVIRTSADQAARSAGAHVTGVEAAFALLDLHHVVTMSSR